MDSAPSLPVAPPAKKRPAHLRAKRTVAVGTLLALTAALAWLCIAFGPQLLAFFGNVGEVRSWAAANTPWSQLAFVGAICTQIVFAFLPGEPLELAAGYAFGFWQGTALCLLGSAVGTALIILAVRGFGLKVVNLFFSTQKVASVSWLSDSRRFELLLFIVFLIPANPKDLLTYVAGLGSCGIGRIVAITTVGRIPSVATSTLTAGALGDGNYVLAAATFGITLLLVAGGVVAYRRLVAREKADTQKAGDRRNATPQHSTAAKP